MGEPGIAGFAIPADMAGGDAATVWRGVQVEPHPTFGYRTTLGIYEMTGPTEAAYSYALRNWQFGDGGAPQFYIPGVQAPGAAYELPPTVVRVGEVTLSQ